MSSKGRIKSAPFLFTSCNLTLPVATCLPEVELISYDESKFGSLGVFPPVRRIQKWYGFRRAENSLVQIEHQTLDSTITKNASLIGKATTFVAQMNGVRVVP